MLNNTAFNHRVIETIAIALGELNKEVVYVGGAVVSLYINNPTAHDVRPTKDIDISLSIATLGELETVREQLNKRGFKQSSEDTVVCRFRYDEYIVDIMNTKAVGWAPANKWFEPGFKRKESIIVNNQIIQILPLAYYLASKFEAFSDRGRRDPRTSHDFEDIIYVLDNRIDIQSQLMECTDEVRDYLTRQFRLMSTDRNMQEAIYGNLQYEIRAERYERIMNILQVLLP
jgi:predicted nucleotidyltransferase